MDDNMAKMMQMDLLTKHVMGGGTKSINATASSGVQSCYEEIFEALYSNEL